MIRLILVGLFLYLIYFFFKYLILVPFRQGLGGDASGKRKNWKPFQREGEISVEYNPEKDKKSKPSVGEYVDYEEIKD